MLPPVGCGDCRRAATETLNALQSAVTIIASKKPHGTRKRIYFPAPARLSSSVKSLRGVIYKDGHLTFDRALYTEEDAQLVFDHAAGHCLKVSFDGLGQAATATEGDLKEINRHASETLALDDVRVFERYSANDVHQRNKPLRFTQRALLKMSKDFEAGRGVHLDHDSSKGFGRTIGSAVEKATVRGVEAHWLKLRFFAVTKNATPERLQLIQDVASGVLGYDSPSILGGAWEYKEEEAPDGSLITFFEVDDDPAVHPRLEAIEISVLSVLGNQYGTGSSDGAVLKPGDSSRQNTPKTSYHYG